MATIKQIKVGSTNYDIKALNATNNNTANFVVRDIKYGTTAPSEGSSGQIYLQYNNSTTSNPYIYAEDEVGSSSTNIVDKYYSKSEVDAVISASVATINDSLVGHNYNWTGSWSNSNSATRTIQITGKGFVFINAYVRNSGADDTGQCDATIELLNTSNTSQGRLSSSGNRISSSSTHQFSANAATAYYYDGSSANRRLKCSFSCTKNGTNSWRIQIMTIGCTVAIV